MRLISLFCAILFVVNKCSAVLNLQISSYYTNIENNRTEYKCGNELLVDELRSLRVDITSDRYIFHAWCIKLSENPPPTKEMDLNLNKYGADMIITGDDVHEGNWNCSFLSAKNVAIDQLNDQSNVYTHSDNATYLLTTCRIIVRVKRSVTLTVYEIEGNGKTKLINRSETSELGSVRIRPGQHLLVCCRKNYEEKRYLKSGSLILSNCITQKPGGYGDNYCNPIKQNITQREISYVLKNDSLLQSIKTSKCKFEIDAGVESSAAMEFTFEDDSSECESHIPDKTGKETIQEILSLSIEKEFLWECRYINMYGAEKLASLQITTIKPPLIIINGTKPYHMATGVYTWDVKQGDRLTILCINQEPEGYLQWSSCFDYGCTNTKPVIKGKIERSFAPKITSVTCIYKTALEEKFNTTVIFKVNQVENSSTQHYPENSSDTFARRHKRSPEYCYTSDTTNNYEGPEITIRYNKKNDTYKCGTKLLLEENETKQIVIYDDNFKKIRCIPKQGEKDFVFCYDHGKRFTAINKSHDGDWDCIFLSEEYQNITRIGVCIDTDRKYYKRMDCQLIIRVNSQPSKTLQQEPTTATKTTIGTPSVTSKLEPTIATNEDLPGSLYTLSPSSAHYGDLVHFTCNAAEVTDGDTIKIKLVSKDGKNCSVTGKINTVTGNYEGSFVMNFTNDVETHCTIYNKKDAKKSDIALKLSYVSTEKIAGKSPKNTNGNNNALIYGAIGGGIVIIAILIIAIWRICRSPPKDSKRKSSVTYENLSNESQGAHPPFPAGAQLEETYIQPNDCIDMESPYAVSRSPETDTYAQPFVPKLEDLYSKPVPKNLRIDPGLLYSQVVPKNQRKPENETSELNYAEIEVKKVDVNDKKKYVNVKDSSPLYASIANQQDYANIAREARKKKNEKDGSEDYSNVFNNEQYCNSKGKPADYAEPTYSQVNNK